MRGKAICQGFIPSASPETGLNVLTGVAAGYSRVMTISALFSLTSTSHLDLFIDARVSAEEI
jgi:hypothetical protein